MIFAGLTSGYIVSQGSSFWVAVKMPSGFFSSTIVIFLSSLFLILAIWAVKKEKKTLLKSSLGLALIGGILFGYFQFEGFKQLFNSGNAVSGQILESSGRYGNIFTLTYEGKSISYDNGRYYWKGKEISEELHSDIRDLGAELAEGGRKGVNFFNLDNYGTGLMLFYENDPVTYSTGMLYVGTEAFDRKQLREVYEFGDNLAEDRGDFIMEGIYGEDFWIYYGGEILEYENRTFYLEGKQLSPKLEYELFDENNTASSFIYALTGVHLLHWIGGIIALLVVFIRGLRDKYTKSDYLGITLGSIYWHFLGILWLYLYVFLIIIH